MKLKLWCLFLGMGLVIGGKAIIAHAENYSVSSIEVVQANNSETQDASREAEIEEATRLTQQAVELYQKGEYTEAEFLFTQALEMTKRLFSGDHPLTAAIFNNLASLYRIQGRLLEAESFYINAAAMLGRLFSGDHAYVATSFNNLAGLYQDQGKYPEAEILFIQALEMRKRLFSGDHPSVAQSLDNLALLYKDQGRYPEAEILFIQASTMYENLFSGDHPDIATSINNLASLYNFQGRYDEAEPLFIKALNMRKRLFSGDHPHILISLSNLASLYFDKRNYDKAESLFTEALKMNRRLFPKDHPYVATNIDSLATLYSYLKRYKDAESLFTEALKMRMRLFSDDHPDVAISLNNLALFYHNQQRYTEAEPLYSEALAMSKRVYEDDHPSIATSLSNFGLFYQAQSQYPQALNYLTQAASVEEAIITENLVIGSEQQKKQFLDLFQHNTNTTISFHLTAVSENAEAAQLALTTILRRKGRVLDAMGQALQTLRDNLDPTSEQLFAQLASTKTQLANLSSRPLPEDAIQRENVQNQQKKLDKQIKQLESQLSFRSAEFRQQTTPVTIEQVQKAIPSNAALVEFIQYRPYDAKEFTHGEPRYAVYVLLPNGQMQWQDLGEAAIIDAQIQQFRQLLSKPTINSQASEQQEELDRAGGLVSKPETNQNSNQKIKQTARELDKLLMQPVRAMTGDATHLLLSPDSQLNLLPFAALVDEEDNYLVENYLITYLTSGRDLLRLQLNLDTETTTPLLFANPTYSAEGVATATKSDEENRGKRSGELGSLTFAPLPGTKTEGEVISQLVPDMTVLTEQQASENNLKDKQNPEFLHLATHGFFLPPEPEEPNNNRNNGTIDLDNQPVFSTAENPLLRSGLALAGFNQRNSGTEDGVLTALEVTGLNLRGTKLVVTSACETGLGDVRAGEGVYGLRRAFTLAGAQSQLMSLWKVSDDGTKDLMVEYYSRIQNGEARGEALRQVQLEMIQSEDRNHPFFWAAFIPSGSWLPLD